jgi:hypothetical protein
MIKTITEKAHAMIIDSQAPIEFWGEAVNTAVYLHQRSPNEGLAKRDDRDGYKAPHEMPYEMHAFGKPTHGDSDAMSADSFPNHNTEANSVQNRSPV